MTWEWMAVVLALLVCAAGLGGWWMYLVHDSEPKE